MSEAIQTKAYLDALREQHGIPYIDARLIKNHRTVAQAATDGALTGDEPLFLYSCTKPVTVTAVMTLVEAGAFTLDTPVSELLPAFARLRMQDGTPCPVALTVRHLMCMAGGLCYDKNAYPIEEALARRTDRSVTRTVVDAIADGRLLFVPGTKFQYSLCHDVLGAVIEAASGMPFSDYMRKTVFEPCGMTQTRFAKRYDDVSPFYETDAQTHEIRARERRNDFVYADGYESGGAGLVSTVNDYAKFAAVLAAGGVTADGRRLVTEESLRALRTSHMTSEAHGFTCIQTSQGEGYAYGLGVRTRTAATAWGLGVGEYGWDGAAGSYLMIDPARGVAAVIGMHLLGWPYVSAGEHLRITERLYRDAGLIG